MLAARDSTLSGVVSAQTLVMLSGGIDSTAALWHVLHNTDIYGSVLVHHIHMHNVEKRWKAEAQAVKSILSYMRTHAPGSFEASESVIAAPAIGKGFLYDVESMGFMSGYITSRAPSITKVVIGATGTDWANSTIPDTVARSKAAHNAFHRDVPDHSGMVKDFPLMDMTKKQVYATLPPGLARLTWSCRTPREAGGVFIECGKCKTCRGEMRSLRQPA